MVAVEVLDPLEVGHGHAARVAEDVGDDEDAVLAQQDVRLGRRRTVRDLGEDARPDARRVLAGQLALERGRREDVDRQLEQSAGC